MHTVFDTENSLPARAQQWVTRAVGGNAAIVSVQKLYGGTSSLVHRVSLRVGSTIRHVVLRRFDNAGWLREEPDLARHEAESLNRALHTGLPTPRCLAFDETGNDCGVPAVLMTQLEGNVDLQPRDLDDLLDAMAAALARIHTIDADGFAWTYFTYSDLATRTTPTWSRIPEQWDQAIRRVRDTRPEFTPCFIHRDYHPTNILWSGNTVSGVVDWVNACAGPAGVDIGHCRVNLAMLYGIDAADRFLSAYEKQASLSFRYDPYWDLLSLVDCIEGPPTVFPGWTALGVTGLSDELMVERLDDYLLRLRELASKTRE